MVDFDAFALIDNPTQPPPPYPPWLCLREAIQLANASSDPSSTITFASYLSGTAWLQSPLPSIAADISISGPANGGVAIQREANAVPFRIFTIEGAVEFGLSNLWIRGGNTDDGGGIYVPEGATANLYQVVFSDNNAEFNGGAIRNDGTVTVEDSAIYQNYARRGGGISNNGTLYVQSDSWIYANDALLDGGGIFNGLNRTCVISNAHIVWNTAGLVLGTGNGAGIFNEGSLHISSSTIAHNTALFAGGGLYCAAQGTNTVISVTISDNSATNGAGSGSGGGFYVEGFATLSVTSSTLTENDADDVNSRGGYVEEFADYSWEPPLPADPVFIEGIA